MLLSGNTCIFVYASFWSRQFHKQFQTIFAQFFKLLMLLSECESTLEIAFHIRFSRSRVTNHCLCLVAFKTIDIGELFLHHCSHLGHVWRLAERQAMIERAEKEPKPLSRCFVRLRRVSMCSSDDNLWRSCRNRCVAIKQINMNKDWRSKEH